MSINRSLHRIAQEGVIQTLEEKDKEIERLKNGCKELEQQIDDLYKLETTLTNENERLNKALLDIKEYIETFEEITGITNRYDYRVKEKLLDIVNKALGSEKE